MHASQRCAGFSLVELMVALVLGLVIMAGVLSIFVGMSQSVRTETAISRLQDEQQRLVVAQLLRERELLDATQRERLVRLLMAQPVGPSAFERLHRD